MCAAAAARPVILLCEAGSDKALATTRWLSEKFRADVVRVQTIADLACVVAGTRFQGQQLEGEQWCKPQRLEPRRFSLIIANNHITTDREVHPFVLSWRERYQNLPPIVLQVLNDLRRQESSDMAEQLELLEQGIPFVSRSNFTDEDERLVGVLLQQPRPLLPYDAVKTEDFEFLENDLLARVYLDESVRLRALRNYFEKSAPSGPELVKINEIIEKRKTLHTNALFSLPDEELEKIFPLIPK
jgi:hypothetical protein